MLNGTEVLWPESLGYYDLMAKREDNAISFDSEYQNEPINPRDCLFNPDDFHFWDAAHPTAESLINSLSDAQYFMAIDPSMGKSTTHGDYSAILIGVRDATKDILYVLEADIDRRTPAELIDAVMGHLRCRDFAVVGIETNGFQQLLQDDLSRRASDEGLSLNLQPIESRKDKTARIQAIQPSIKNARIQFSGRSRVLLDQLKYFPKGRHDDGPDALEMLYQTAKDGGLWGFV